MAVRDANFFLFSKDVERRRHGTARSWRADRSWVGGGLHWALSEDMSRGGGHGLRPLRAHGVGLLSRDGFRGAIPPFASSDARSP